MQNYSIQVTEAADAPDLIEELKSHLRLNNGTDEDDELERFVGSALSLWEFATNSVALPTTFRQWFPNFNSVLELARSPVISIEEVGYYDGDDEPQTLAAYDKTTAPGGWRADLTGNSALVYLPNCTAPSTSTLRVRPVYVDYVAGAWADVDYMPSDAVLAVLLLAAHFYNNRESHTELDLKELPQGFQRVCQKYSTGKGGV